jgi:periplasmic copper chaperone A
MTPVLAVALLATSTALAHITLETRQAPVGSTYKAVFRVPHGCKGKPTTAIRVQIPDGVSSAKPQPKAGWTLDKIQDGKAVKEIVWSNGNLPDDEYDEFVLHLYLMSDLKPESVVYFPVIQECADGAAERWIEIPEAGKSAADYAKPAPGLTLLPKK